jgi:hypothetical protein
LPVLACAGVYGAYRAAQKKGPPRGFPVSGDCDPPVPAE